MTHSHVLGDDAMILQGLINLFLSLFWASESFLCPEGFGFHVSRLMWCFSCFLVFSSAGVIDGKTCQQVVSYFSVCLIKGRGV